MLLSAKNVCKWYGRQLVLKNVTLQVAGSTVVALTGANGAGKSTLLSLLATLSKADQGEIELLGTSYTAGDTRRIRQHLGVVLHEPALYSNLTAHENLAFFAQIYGIPDAATRITDCLQAVQLTRRSGWLVKTLSNGMRKRLALARAMLSEPKLLLLDEPETGLDSDSFAILVSLLSAHRAAGGTAILATHNQPLIQQLDATEIKLTNGEIAQDSTQ